MTTQEKRQYAADLMVSRKGKNSYTQGADRVYFFGKPDNQVGNTAQKGYSDCSSAVRTAIKAAAGIDIGSNTSAQINNRGKGQIVHQTDGYYPDVDVLLPGDCLYFKGNSSHPLDVGHVEMYIGNGKCCGHGSGTGPKVRDVREYCASRASSTRRYFMTIRWIADAEGEDGARRTLKRGMEGPDVVKLQQALLALGYSIGAYGTDGDFGGDTEAAVIAFQEANGLTADGIAGPDTLDLIDKLLDGESDAPENEPEPTPVVPDYRMHTIAEGSWNVRTGPGKEYAAAGIVRGGDKIEGVDTQGWIPVIFNGEVRWISPKAVGR